MKRTPLYNSHVALGAKMVPFAGWEMPVRYPAGLIEEHRAVRERVGIFDVSHMGEIEVRGSSALTFLERLTPNSVASMNDGQAQYSALTNEQGGIIDDLIIYRVSEDNYLLCVNASNTDVAFEWMQSHQIAGEDVEISNQSDRYSQVAIQGPKAFALLEKIFGKDLREDIPRFWFNQCFFEGAPVLVARTGYTGEDGVEVWIPPSGVEVFWDAVLEAGEEFGVLPCGLGARDTLRLEAAYPLHGHELGPEISAIESGLRWIVKLKQKGEFIGRAIIEEQITNGAPRALVGFFVRDPGIVREGSEVQSEDGKTVGTVTSGTQTPTVGRALGLALVDRSFSQKGAVLKAVVRGKPVSIEVTSTPFYRGEGV